MKSILLIQAVFCLAEASLPNYNGDSTFTALHNSFGLTRPSLLTRDLSKRQCSGSCSECFGSGYTDCPDSLLYCYKPGDANYGLDSCPGGSSGGDSGDSSSCASQYGSDYAECPNDSSTCYDTTSSSGSLACYGDGTTTDYCQEGSSCTVCFGSGFEECPNDSTYCYQPGNATSCCPGNCDSSGGSPGGSSSSFDYSSYITSSYYATETDMTTIPTSSSYYTLDFTSDAVTTTASPSASGRSGSDFPATTSDTESTESATSESQPAETSVEQQETGGATSLTISMAALGGITFSWMLVAL